MNSLLNSEIRIMSLRTHNNTNDLSQTFLFGKDRDTRTLPLNSLIWNLIITLLLGFVVTNTAKAVEGNVDIDYSISSIGQGANYDLHHSNISGISEGLDNYDGRYYEMYTPDGIAAKAVSVVEGVELDSDVRIGSDPPSGVSVSLSVVTQNGEPVYLPAGTSHNLNVSVSGYPGYKVYIDGEDITTGGIINLGSLSEGWYSDGASTGSVSISFESLLPPPPEIEIPSVDTLSASNIGETVATLEGIILNDGGENCSWRFKYKLEGDSYNYISWAGALNTGNEFQETITGLTPNTQYYFVAEAKNSAGESSGGLESFITRDSGTPPQPPEEPQDLQEGILDIFYKIASLEEGRDTAKFEIVHKSGASEDLDENDMLYENKDLYTHPKIVSIIWSGRRHYELQKDSRPEESLTGVYLNTGIEPAESFIISKQELILKMPLLNKNFGDKPIVIQQYDISDPNGYPSYDVRKLIEEGKGEGIIKLQDLQDADKFHEQYFELSFNRSVADINLDGIVDSNDYSFIEKNWQKQGNSKADIGSHKGTGLPDGRVDYWDAIAMSEEWTGETIDPNITNLIDYRTESFETGGFNKFNWKHSGDFNWIITPEKSYSGFYSAKSGPINNNETSSLEVSVDCQPGFIAFYRKVSSENNFDKLKFYIDDVLKDESSGESDWKRANFPVEEGRRKFTWNYDKDGSVSRGDDAVYIDEIVFPVE